MSDQSENLERLASEWADGLLTPIQHAEFERTMNQDPALALAVRRYERLQAELRGWRALPAGIDWQATGQRFASRIAADSRGLGIDSADPATLVESAQSSEAMDDLLRRAIPPLPPVDWIALQRRISTAVREQAAAADARRRVVPGMRRWKSAAIATLAAAAVVVLALRQFAPESVVAPGTARRSSARVVVRLEAPTAEGRVRVAFVEEPGQAPPPAGEERGGLAIAIGPPDVQQAEAGEEALLF